MQAGMASDFQGQSDLESFLGSFSKYFSVTLLVIVTKVNIHKWNHAENTGCSYCLHTEFADLKTMFRDFPGGAVVGNPPANAGDTGSSPGPGRPHMLRSN